MSTKPSGCIFAIALLAGGCSSQSDQEARQELERLRAKQNAGAWHSGGQLHDATLRTWKAASYRNRLATSADFAAAIVRSSGTRLNSLEDLKPYAERMERCITEASDVPEKVENTPVVEIAASCQVLFDVGI